MRKAPAIVICAFLGAIILISAAESDWLLAGTMGVALGLAVALFIHVYPRDLAPPADRRHEAAQRQKSLRA